MSGALDSLEARVAAAVGTVDDPEFPGVSVVELGLLESIRVDRDGRVRVSLLPTFSGCPALSMIGDDVPAGAPTARPWRRSWL